MQVDMAHSTDDNSCLCQQQYEKESKPQEKSYQII